MLRPRRDMRRETSPSNTPITTPMRIGNFDISAGELLSGTIVATIESTSSTTGTASATASTLPSKARGTHVGGRRIYAGAKTPGTSGYSS